MLKQTINSILLVAGIATALLPLSVSAQNTTVNLNITAGVLTLYAGDAVDNNDICTVADDGNVVETIACNASERTISLTGLTTTNQRQNTSATIEDVLFEDLRGLATTTYTVSASVSDFTDGTKTIALGSNPDGATTDADADAPVNSSIFAVLDPSIGTVDTIAPAIAEADQTKFTPGSRTVITNTTTTTTILTTGVNSVLPSRTEIDGTEFKLRVPAYVAAGNYTGTITFTIV
jgi:hypothetical protein